MAKTKADATKGELVKPSANLPPANPDLMNQLAELSGEGLEEVTSRDILIPRITILQALSPQLQSKKPEHIKGAQAGDICDVSTGTLWKDSIKVVPVYYEVRYLEWAPRSTGKGLVAIHNSDDCLAGTTKNERGQNVTASGNTIVESAQFYLLNLSDGKKHSFVAMSSTQRKKAKKWITLATGERIKTPSGKEVIPPLYYRAYTLSVSEESNAEGSWLGWKIERAESLNEMSDGAAILDEARAFRASVVSGKSQASLEAIAEESKASTEEVM